MAPLLDGIQLKDWQWFRPLLLETQFYKPLNYGVPIVRPYIFRGNDATMELSLSSAGRRRERE